MDKTHQLNRYLNAYKEGFDSEDLHEDDKNFFLTLISTKYLVRKNKN